WPVVYRSAWGCAGTHGARGVFHPETRGPDILCRTRAPKDRRALSLDTSLRGSMNFFLRRACAAFAGLVLASRVAAITLPPGFGDALVAGIGAPTALAFTPDGRLLVTTQGGTLRIVSGGTLLATPALTLGSKVCSNSERGLLGVAVDPSFT